MPLINKRSRAQAEAGIDDDAAAPAKKFRAASEVGADDGETEKKKKEDKRGGKAGKDAVTVVQVDAPEAQRSDKGDVFFALSAKRRVTVQEFKSTTLIAVREFYEKNDKMLPGKQGISLTVEQFATLLRAAEGIKRALAEKGVVIVDGDGKEEDEGGKEEDEGGEEGDEVDVGKADDGEEEVVA